MTRNSTGRRASNWGTQAVVGLLLAAAVTACTACQTTANNGGGSDSAADTSLVALPLTDRPAMPAVRVLLKSLSGGAGPVEFEAINGAKLSAGSARPPAASPGAKLSARLESGQIKLEWAGASGFSSAGPILVEPLTALDGAPVFRIGGREYEGSLVLHVVSGRLEVVNQVDMAAYIRGSLPSEMPAGWHVEALKAQAVAIRSYTAFTVLSRGGAVRTWDVDDTTAYLRYAGVGGEDGKLADRHRQAVARAESETSREVLVWRGRLLKSYFHSTSGGQTTSCEVAFGQPAVQPLAGAVLGDFGSASGMHRWSRELTTQQVTAAAQRAGHQIGAVVRVSAHGAVDGGWNKSVRLLGEGGQVEIPAADFRRMLGVGRDGLPSTNFTVTVDRGVVKFEGRGWGHGVGLDQWASKGMADAGKSHRAILHSMYPGAEVVRALR